MSKKPTSRAKKPPAAANGKPPVAAWPADRVVRLNVEDLYPYARNARLHTNAQVDQLANAIKRWGVTNPVIVDARGEIIAGHGRIMAARRLGLEDFPGVVIADGEWSEDDKRAYRIWDNQSALLSEWSSTDLRTELLALQGAKYDLNLTGFDPKSLVTFMASTAIAPPGQFPAFGENLATEHSCPKCGYRWSGNPDAAPKPAVVAEKKATGRAVEKR